MNYLFFCLCFRSRSRRDHRKKLDKAAAQIEREMDLGRFIRRQRQHTIAILGLLSGKQAHLVTKMSQLTINDGAGPFKYPDKGSCSDGSGVGDQKARALNADRFVKRMFESTDKVDKKLL